ncbi:ABC transporter ATP-binding protein [Niallia oryzisoli]|uniref:ABC transporter ATP-binding protein n=1 Tax=Niallia oryzisoli TaxID=1737571 RepID=A0ABZ2C7M0_9BACI
MIGTLLKPDGGTVSIDGYTLGKDDNQIRSILGTVFQDHVLDNLLSVKENLITRGSFYYSNRTDLLAAFHHAAQITGVTEYLDRPYGKLSGGQKRRSDIARALVSSPKILILDEPTTGLDPHTRQDVWQAIEQLKNEKNMTIFLTTHYMEEAAKADYVVVIEKGRIVAKGTPAEIKEQYSSDHLILYPSKMEEVIAILKNLELSYNIKVDTVTVELESTLKALPILERCKDMLRGFQVVEGNMDDAFIAITGKELQA